MPLPRLYRSKKAPCIAIVTLFKLLKRISFVGSVTMSTFLGDLIFPGTIAAIGVYPMSKLSVVGVRFLPSL